MVHAAKRTKNTPVKVNRGFESGLAIKRLERVTDARSSAQGNAVGWRVSCRAHPDESKATDYGGSFYGRAERYPRDPQDARRSVRSISERFERWRSAGDISHHHALIRLRERGEGTRRRIAEGGDADRPDPKCFDLHVAEDACTTSSVCVCVCGRVRGCGWCVRYPSSKAGPAVRVGRVAWTKAPADEF